MCLGCVKACVVTVVEYRVVFFKCLSKCSSHLIQNKKKTELKSAAIFFLKIFFKGVGVIIVTSH